MISAKTLRPAIAAIALFAIGATGAWAQDKITVTSEKPVAAADVPADAVVVGIEKMKYLTPEVTIKAGETVYWVNGEVMPHNVAFKKGIVGEDAFRGEMMTKDPQLAASLIALLARKLSLRLRAVSARLSENQK